MIPPQFLIIPYQLIQDSAIKPMDERVYGIIYWLTQLKGEKCFASNPILAEMAKTTPNTLQHSLSRLEKGEYIMRTYKDNSKRHRNEIIPLIVFARVLPTDNTVVLPTDNSVLPTDNTVVLPTDNQNKSNVNNKNKEELPKGRENKVFGNPEINELIKYLTDTLGGSLDGSIQQNRRFAHLLINKFKKDYPNKDPVQQIKHLIDFGLKDTFHGKNISNFRYLYYNAQKIILSAKNRKPLITVI